MPVQKCQVNGKLGWKWGESGKCYTGADAKAKAEAQGRAVHATDWEGCLVFPSQSFPASFLGGPNTPPDMHRYRKELIKVGKYIKESTGQTFEVTKDTLLHWVNTFQRWIANGNKVPIPLGHDRADEPEKNAGWVVNMMAEGKSLFAIMEILDPALAKTTDVSICVENKVTDGKGIKYTAPITHVALCVDPVVPGLKDFETLSLSKGVKKMEIPEFLKKIAEKLGIKDKEPTKEAILLALESGTPANVISEGSIDIAGDDGISTPVVKLISENRAIKLSGLVKAGLLTPAAKDLITAKYIEPKALTLELSKGDDGGFDLLYTVLTTNKPVDLEEVTGHQSLELAGPSDVQVSPVTRDINARRVAAGMTN